MNTSDKLGDLLIDAGKEQEKTKQAIESAVKFFGEHQVTMERAKKRWAGCFIYSEHHLYKEDENPLRVFRARQIAREYGLDVPQWVEEYFDSVTDGLLNAEVVGRSESVIKETLDISDGHFKAFRESQQDSEIADQVWEELKKGNKEYIAYKIVAGRDNGLKKSAIRDRFKKYEPILRAFYNRK